MLLQNDVYMRLSNGNTACWAILRIYIVLHIFSRDLPYKIPVEIHLIFLEIVNAKTCDFNRLHHTIDYMYFQKQYMCL